MAAMLPAVASLCSSFNVFMRSKKGKKILSEAEASELHCLVVEAASREVEIECG